MIMVTGVKVFVVIGPNFRVRGVYSSQRQALAWIRTQNVQLDDKGYSVETWVVDGNGTLENSI